MMHLRIDCTRCGGGDLGCSTCAGKGVEIVKRCPMALLRGTGTFEVFEAYGDYKAGYLPVAGAIYDQSASFMKAVRMIDAAVNRHQDSERRRMEQRSKRGAQRRRNTGSAPFARPGQPEPQSLREGR